MMMKEVFLLVLVVWMAISVLAREPPEHISKNKDTSDKLIKTPTQNTKQQNYDGEDPSGILGRSSSQKNQRNLRVLTNYILHGNSYWSPTDPELFRQLRVRPTDAGPKKGKFKKAAKNVIKKCKKTGKKAGRGWKKVLKAGNEECELTDENNQNGNEADDTVDTMDTAPSPFLIEDSITSYSFPTLLIDAALGYFSRTYPDFMLKEIPSGCANVSGLHSITAEDASLTLTEESVILNVSLLLPLNLETIVMGDTCFNILITHKARLSIKLQLYSAPKIELNEFSWKPVKDDYPCDSKLKIFMKICKRSCLELVEWIWDVEKMIENLVNISLNDMSTMLQMYAGFDGYHPSELTTTAPPPGYCSELRLLSTPAT